MQSPERVVFDTSALYALISASDLFHAQARETYAGLLAAGKELWLPSYVLVEFGALVQSRLGFDILSRFYEAAADLFEYIWVSGDLHREAWAELTNRQGRGLSLVDWTVLLGARHLGAQVFTFDAHFRNEGATIVPDLKA